MHFEEQSASLWGLHGALGVRPRLTHAWRRPAGQEYGLVFSVTDKQCVPVHEVVYRSIQDSVSTGFYDVTLGINDPNVFTPPEECKGAKMVTDPSRRISTPSLGL